MEDFLAQGDAPVYIGFGSMKAKGFRALGFRLWVHEGLHARV